MSLSCVGIQPSAGGVEVYLESSEKPEELEQLVTRGRQIALQSAMQAGHQVNTLASEHGPHPVDKNSNQTLLDQDPEKTHQQVKAARAAGNLVYRKKFVFSFSGF